ncbi:hemolysin family protein [Haloplanus aerogenes]|uniref:CBS domain containing-hemolysin-like protein n=1 Tax=Haloplanus aerogenes TaxID=660522 RepID=A0A3M0DCA8_9EURY|nr:hemolysin family protein [Haloplanus aerogenes]AZH27077.1 HlyC/CorC family transporter [Haloplanus aerogenes]RMB13423.1 CBS domain containing-hemolysin-like protein [Haloplanus aerogenes]
MGLSPTASAAGVGSLAQLSEFVPLTDTTVTIAGSLAILVLIALSAFFSSSEIAMFSLARHRVESLVEEGVPGAAVVQELKSDPHRLLITILVGNNIVNIAMSSIATGLFAIYLSQGQAVLAATFGITTLVLLFGESAPKSYAVENTESWALRIASPLKYSELALLPLVVVFDYLTRIVNRVTGGRSAIETTYVTRDEIQNMIQTGEREGVIEEEEREMFQRIFRFNRTIAKEVMTPRLDMTAVPKDATLDEAIETCVQSDHERIPVYEGNLDNIIGIVTLRDLIREKDYGEGQSDLTDVVQPTLHVPESKNVDELLEEIQDNRMRMVIVIDEFGTTEGLITLEDMVEEIVGDILEGDEEEPFEFVEDDVVIVRGEVNIDEVNETLDLDLPEGEEFETLAGFIFNRAGRLVEEGETIEYDSITIRIEQVDNTRIMKARITIHEDADEEESPDEAEAEG